MGNGRVGSGGRKLGCTVRAAGQAPKGVLGTSPENTPRPPLPTPAGTLTSRRNPGPVNRAHIVPASMLPWPHREQPGPGAGVTSWGNLGVPPATASRQMDGPAGNRCGSLQGLQAGGPPENGTVSYHLGLCPPATPASRVSDPSTCLAPPAAPAPSTPRSPS